MLLFLRKVSNPFYALSKEDYSPEPNLENNQTTWIQEFFLGLIRAMISGYKNNKHLLKKI